MTTDSPIPIYILAGGRSSRFGSDKARALIGTEPLIAYVAGQLQPFASGITVVADRVDKYQDLGLATIMDKQPHLGPLGGLLTALEHCSNSEWLLLTACDTVILDMTFVEQLLGSRDGTARIIAVKGDQWETMPALYHTSVLPQVRECLDRGQRALWRLIESVPHHMIRYSAQRPVIAQINSGEDLQQFCSAQVPRP